MLRLLSVFSILVFMMGCATGSVIITGDARPAIDPSAVKIYTTPPAEYETIGLVEVKSEVVFSSQSAQNTAVNELKRRAGRIGANGVILRETGEQTGPTTRAHAVGDSSVYTFQDEYKILKGEAIYVITE